MPPEETIPLPMAMKAAQAVLDACAPYGEPAVAEIMDMYGNPKVVLAADASLGNSPEAARKKAYTAMKKGMSTADFAKTLDHKPVRGEVIQGDPNLNANDGGFPIRRDGKVIGALGASSPAGKHSSGATYDEYCGEAGLAEIHF
ncbi:MAG: heme-binding protein [Rhizomicrobium sp.]